MSAAIIDGKAFAATIRAQVAQETAAFREKTGIQPGLAVVLVGKDPASEVYVRNKGIQAKEAGFNSLEYRLPENTTQAELLAQVAALNADPQVHGILVQLPLPAHLDADAVLNAIAPDKDVDGFHPVNVGRLWTGNPVSVPCTPLGCALILKDRIGDLAGKRAIVIGRSNIVGKPELVRGDWLKPGATVLDVGINRIADGDKTRLVGDVHFASAAEVASAITPVPGGIGPMTIACLLRNTLACAKALHALHD